MGKLKSIVTIAVSYNEQIGGATANSIRKLIIQSGAKKVDIDYYDLVPEVQDIDEIYQHADKIATIFWEAKLKASTYLQTVDCLILPGNCSDVDPRLYGEILPDEDKNRINLRRALAEMVLAYAAIQKGMPILAICGGHQILNVLLGGKLKHVSDEASDKYIGYSINQFTDDSELGQIIFKKLKTFENQFFGAHTQVVDENNIGGKNMVYNGDFLSISAISKDDLTIEAMESNVGSPIYSLQFHPEVALVGMYSVLAKTVTYFAPTKESLNCNFNIIKAAKQAAETYAAKRKLNLAIESETFYTDNYTVAQGKNDTTCDTKLSVSQPSFFYNVIRETSVSHTEIIKQDEEQQTQNFIGFKLQ